MGRPEDAGVGAGNQKNNPFFRDGHGGAPPANTRDSGVDMTSMRPPLHDIDNNDNKGGTKTDINRHAYTSRAAAGADDFGDVGDDLPPGYSPGAGPPAADAGALPPAYGADSNVAGAVAENIDPLGLVISGHYVYRDTEDPNAPGYSGPPNPAQPPPVASAGPALYSMNRGIASLSYTDSLVTFERLDHSVRKHTADGPRIVQRSRHLFDLRHFDDLTASTLHAAPLKGFRDRADGGAWDYRSEIPRFYCQATSRRSLGSFGLRQVKIRGSGFSALKGAQEQGYDVVPLARRKAEHDTPRFAFGEKGTGLARPMFTARLRSTDASGASGGSGGGFSSKFGKGKAKAAEAQAALAVWEWLDELGQVVAHEDMAWRGVLPDTHVQGQALPLVDTSGIPQVRQCHRLVTTSPLAREAFDVLVSSWCLRVWWQSADFQGPLRKPGIRRSLQAAQEYGIGPSNYTWGFGHKD